MRKRLRSLLALLVVLSMVSSLLIGCQGQEQTSGEAKADTEQKADQPAESAKAEEKPGEVNWITEKDISKMPETTIRYWFYETPERVELGKKQIEEFTKLYPNIKITGSTAPDNTDNEMLMSFVQSRTNSNIQQSVNNEDLWYIDNKMLYPLNNFPDYKEVMDRFNPALNYTWIDGNTYSISWYFGSRFMFYNKKMVEKAGLDPNNLPKTYSEYYDWAKKLTNPGAKQWAIAPWMGEEWWRWQFVVYPFYIAAKGDSQTVNKDGKTAAFNNDAGKKSLEFYGTLFKNGWATKENFDMDPFVSGQAATALGATDLIKTIKNDGAPDFEYVIGPLPLPDGVSEGQFNTYSFVRNFCIIDELGVKEGEERDRVRRASWEFMKFLLSDEQLAADFAVSGDLPAVKDLKNNAKIAPVLDQWGDKMKQAYDLGSKGTIGDMYTSLICDIHDPLTKSYLKVAVDGMDPAEAIAWAEKEANNILSKGRE